MKKQQLRVPGVKNWELNNIVGGIVYNKEAIKREKDPDKLISLQKRFDELKVELSSYKTA